MALYKCVFKEENAQWEVYCVKNGIRVLVFNTRTKLAAREYCTTQGKGSRHVVFNDSTHEFEVGALNELFHSGQPGFKAVSGAIDGFNNLVCRGRAEKGRTTIKRIHQSRLHLDMAKLGDIFNLNVLEIGDIHV